MSAFSVFLRWNPNWKHQSAFGRGSVNYFSQFDAKNFTEAKKEAEQYQRDYDLGFLELILVKGTLKSTFTNYDTGFITGRSSAVYLYPSRKDIPNKKDRQWVKLAPKNTTV